ncbi:MAG: hypothetical protein JW866_10320 [Ignavibacteriales bacterium]|nr:hypothetical protein [Ignavibacteriales bacterium]
MKRIKNRIIASNLIFITAGLGLLNFYFARDLFISGSNISIAVFTILFLVGLGFLARKDIKWIKWVFLVIMIIGLFSLPQILNNLYAKPMVGIINLIQTILQLAALLLLFIKDRLVEN